MPQDGKPKLAKELFGDFAWKCEMAGNTYDNRTTFARGPRATASPIAEDRFSQRATSTSSSGPSVIVPSVAQPEPSARVLDGFDVDDNVKTGKPPDEHAARDLTDVRERCSIN